MPDSTRGRTAVSIGPPLEAGFSATRPRDTEIPRSTGPGARASGSQALRLAGRFCRNLMVLALALAIASALVGLGCGLLNEFPACRDHRQPTATEQDLQGRRRALSASALQFQPDGSLFLQQFDYGANRKILCDAEFKPVWQGRYNEVPPFHFLEFARQRRWYEGGGGLEWGGQGWHGEPYLPSFGRCLAFSLPADASQASSGSGLRVTWRYQRHAQVWERFDDAGRRQGALGANGFVTDPAGATPFGRVVAGFQDGDVPSLGLNSRCFWITADRVYRLDFAAPAVEMALAGERHAVDFPAAPSAVDGQVGRGCQYPTPVASPTRDRQSPRAATQKGEVNSVAGEPLRRLFVSAAAEEGRVRCQAITASGVHHLWLVNPREYRRLAIRTADGTPLVGAAAIAADGRLYLKETALPAWRETALCDPTARCFAALYRVSAEGIAEEVNRHTWDLPVQPPVPPPSRAVSDWPKALAPLLLQAVPSHWRQERPDPLAVGLATPRLCQTLGEVALAVRFPGLVPTALVSVAWGLLGVTLARRRGQSRAALALWLPVVLAFNLAGLLAWRLCEEHGVRACVTCGRRTAAARAVCQHCGGKAAAEQELRLGARPEAQA